MESDKVIDLDRPKSSLLDALGRPPRPEGAEPLMDLSLLTPDELSALPQADDDYAPHARIAGRPLATIFFLAKGQLPDGFAYSGFERVRMVPGGQPGAGPVMVVRFNGSAIYEVRIEGRNLLSLCSQIGRHVIQWVREHPTGRDESGDDKAVFIRRIEIREIERG